MKRNRIERKNNKNVRLAIIGVGIIILSMFIITGIIYYSVMNKHIDTYKNARGLADFSQYEDLEREEASFFSNEGKKLQGYFYKYIGRECNKGVIIVNNGFGVGHEAMLAEIEALAMSGYLVYGFDKTGYDASEGNGIGSLTQGVYDLANAIEYVSTSTQASDMDIILYGKSWGAYCSLAVLNKTDKVSAVVSMAAFNETSDMMRGEATRMLGSIGQIITPFTYFYDWINEEGITAVSGIGNSSAEILIMHSRDDEIVDVARSYFVFENEYGNQERVNFVLYDDKNHTIISSKESKQYNQQMDSDLQIFAEENGGEMTEELWDVFLSRYDLRKCSKPDEEVLAVIISFLEKR